MNECGDLPSNGFHWKTCIKTCINVNHTDQIDQQTSHIEFDANFPLQVYLENDKSSLDAEGPNR